MAPSTHFNVSQQKVGVFVGGWASVTLVEERLRMVDLEMVPEGRACPEPSIALRTKFALQSWELGSWMAPTMGRDIIYEYIYHYWTQSSGKDHKIFFFNAQCSSKWICQILKYFELVML